MGRRWVSLLATIAVCLAVMALAPVRVTFVCAQLAAGKGEICYCPPGYDCSKGQIFTEWMYVARIFTGDKVLAKDELYSESTADLLRNFGGALVIGGVAYVLLRRGWHGQRADM